MNYRVAFSAAARHTKFGSVLVALLIIGLFTLRCSETGTGNEKVTFSGTVTLEGQTDYSGVKVSLYAPVKLDTALERINQQYPAIGFQISQKTAFDHRAHEPLYTTVTDGDGNWEIEAEDGTYNIVAEMNGFGWKYIYETSQKTTDVELKEVILLKGSLVQDYDIPAGSFVEIDNTVTIFPDNGLTLNTPVTLLFKNNGRLIVRGRLFTQNGSEVFYFNDNETTQSSLNMEIESAHKIELKHLYFINTKNPIYINGSSQVSLEQSYFADNTTGIDVLNTDSLFINNCIFAGCETAIYSRTANINFTRNVVKGAGENGYVAINDDNSEIRENVFENFENAISVNPGFTSLESRVNVLNNDFKNNNVHIRIRERGYVKAHYNNFLFSESYVVIAPFTEAVYDFTMNFWDAFQESDIAARIYDSNDDPQLGSTVDFSDYLTEKVNWP